MGSGQGTSSDGRYFFRTPSGYVPTKGYWSTLAEEPEGENMQLVTSREVSEVIRINISTKKAPGWNSTPTKEQLLWTCLFNVVIRLKYILSV